MYSTYTGYGTPSYGTMAVHATTLMMKHCHHCGTYISETYEYQHSLWHEKIEQTITDLHLKIEQLQNAVAVLAPKKFSMGAS